MNENIEELKNKYFKDESPKARMLFISINIFSIVIWVFSIFMILKNHKKDRMYYLIFISGVIVTCFFINRLINHFQVDNSIDMHLGADYRICQTGPDGLSKKELEKGAVGLVDYECSINAWKRITNTGDGYRTGAYYITYTIFALVLTHAKLTGKSNETITQIMRYLLLFGILAITASRYCTEWVLSVFPLTLSSNFTIMMSVLASLLLVEIISMF